MEDFEGYARQRRGIPDGLREGIAFGIRQLLKMAAQHCDAVIVADEGTARFFRQYTQRVLVLHNYPDLSLFPDLSGQRGAEYDLVYHGSIPRYHLDACLAIDDALCRKGFRAKWRLFGNMPDREWFDRELANRGVSDRFHVSGLVPHDQVAMEVRKARIGIIPLPALPKFQNNIPQKLFEFMALGMPTVLSDLPPSRPFVGDGACAIMVPPNDYDAYADGILGLISDPVRCLAMGVEARRRVREEFNWEAESRKLIDLYQAILR
jgi:glycosyltransferase involved in cell wall biosynthesis